ENTWTDNVTDSTLVFKKDIFNHVCFRKQKVGSDKRFQRDCKVMGYNIFSTDRYNHAVIRSKNEKHTWKISEQRYINMLCYLIYITVQTISLNQHRISYYYNYSTFTV